MAKRRQPAASEIPTIPRELLEPRHRAVLLEWFAHFGLTARADQLEARQHAFAAYGLDRYGRDPDAPDPREFFRHLPTKSAAPIPPRRRNAARRGPSPNSEETTP